MPKIHHLASFAVATILIAPGATAVSASPEICRQVNAEIRAFHADRRIITLREAHYRDRLQQIYVANGCRDLPRANTARQGERQPQPERRQFMVRLPDSVPVPPQRPDAENVTAAIDTRAERTMTARPALSQEDYAKLAEPRPIPEDRSSVRVVGWKFLPDADETESERFRQLSAGSVSPVNAALVEIAGLFWPSAARADSGE